MMLVHFAEVKFDSSFHFFIIFFNTEEISDCLFSRVMIAMRNKKLVTLLF